ncbi:MAG TPA: DUF5916 domain-containing protein [Longimicrobiales bacterium]|nr:DUF5916 domain-containing protein [Longimicrobiales bacterium]
MKRYGGFAGLLALGLWSGSATDALGQRAEAAGGPSGGNGTLCLAERRSEIRIDGLLDEPAWEGAPVVTDFVQGEPVEGAAAEQPTEVRLLFDDEAIYVGARLAEPGGRIARQLVRRDETGQADYFEVSFDPNRDRRTGYQFRVSAAGVQRDAYLFDDDRQDDSWNAVWEAEVAVGRDGWSVEMRIPWSQVRYEPGSRPQTWGVNFVRWRVAAGERTYWALVPRNQHGRVSFFRAMEDVRVPDGARRLELRPYALGRTHSGPAEPGDPFFGGRETDIQAGVDLRYGLGSAFTLDATLNPDFGQVELDPAVINLSAFETFFDEKRPFFVEDARIFDFSLGGFRDQLFYSRRIGREPQGSAPEDATHADIPDQSTILGAAKLTGRTTGGLSLGALAAVTAEEEGVAAFAGDEPGASSQRAFVAQPRSWHGVARARQDLRAGATTVGGILTAVGRELPGDRSFAFLPSSAYTAGVDFEHMWGDREWAVEGYLAGSMVRGDSVALVEIQRSSNHYFQRPDGGFTVDSGRTSLAGASWEVGVERRSGEHWTGGVSVGRATGGFEVNDLGFSGSSESMGVNARVRYREVQPGRLFRSYEVELTTFQNWRGAVLESPLDGAAWKREHKNGSVWTRGQWTLNNFWGGRFEYAYRPEVLSDVATRGGPLMVDPANQKIELRGNTDERKRLSFGAGGGYETGEAVRALDFEVGVTWRPVARLELELEPGFEVATVRDQYVATLDTLPYAPTFGSHYLFGELERRSVSLETRLNVTFTRDLTLQLFARPLLDAGEYTSYKRLDRAASFAFTTLETGAPADLDGDGAPATCAGGALCEVDGTQYVDLDGDGAIDGSFGDRDFNLVSLRGNAVVRWEYRPGSTLFLVWQQRRSDRRPFGDFDFARDRADLLDVHPDNIFILKLNYWLGL